MNDTNILKKETKNLTKANFEEVIKEYLKDYFYNKETKIDIHICTKDDYLQSSSSGTRLYYDDKIEDKLPMLLDNFEEGLYNCIIADDFVEDDDGDDEYGRPIILEFCFRSITFEKIYDADTLIKKANNYIHRPKAHSPQEKPPP